MFTGFSEETVDFMWGIRFNNERNWFRAHKEQYVNSFQTPMKELGGELWAYLDKKRPDAGLILRVTRIYRDARRLFGRGPYKDHLWFTVERPREDWTGNPAFWFELGPDYWSCGLGYWMPKPVLMAKLRARIDREPETMAKLTRRLNRSREFSLDMEEYRRPRSQPPSDLLAPWYRAKSFSLYHGEWLSELLYGREIVERLKKDFRFLLPYFDYLDTLDGDPDPMEEGKRRKNGEPDGGNPG